MFFKHKTKQDANVKLIAILIIIVLVAVAEAGIWFMLDGLLTPPQSSLPPLLEGLPADFTAAEETFAARIAAMFPLGSQEIILIITLDTQGFEQKPATSGFKRVASDRSRFPCTLVWEVKWTADQEARLTLVKTRYDRSCL